MEDLDSLDQRVTAVTLEDLGQLECVVAPEDL